MRALNIVVGVGGGIAAYKACMVIRQLTGLGHRVTAVPTRAAQEFIGVATLEALTGRPVHSDVFSDIPQVKHVAVGAEADLVIVVPTTAHLLSQIACGAAGDMLTTTLLMAQCPVLLAPAMHTQMWENMAVQRNVQQLRKDGYVVMEPDSGRLTGPDEGPGRLPDPMEIVEMALSLVENLADDAATAPTCCSYPQDLRGRRIVVTAGGTQEALDPVRYLGNRSSGLQGAALAAVARQRGAEVTLILANNTVPYHPAGVTVVSAPTAQSMLDAVMAAAPQADIVVMAAAVADFRPTTVSSVKLKKGDESEPDSIPLTRNPDILRTLVEDPSLSALLVGCAAETGNSTAGVLELGREKLASKGCDVLFVNEVGENLTFGQPTNAGWILSAQGERALPRASKRTIAHLLWDSIVDILPSTMDN